MGLLKTNLTQMITSEQLDTISVLERKYPNNMDLGKEVRILYRDNDFVRSYPNDMDLGKELRSILLKKRSKEATR